MEEKILITVGRQIGSGGLQVARLLAKELGVDVYDKNLLMMTAKESGIAPEILASKDEKPAGLGRFAKFLGIRSSVYADSQVYSDASTLSSDDLFALQSQVIRDVADKGSGIFVGRCADYVLRDYSHMMSVFITADEADRIARVMNRENLDESGARKFIADGERKRSDYYNYYTFKKWGSSASYDLCLNTSRFGMEQTAAYIIRLYKEFKG